MASQAERSSRTRARQSLRWRLPLLVSLLVSVVLATFLAAAYHQVKIALLDAGGDRAQGAADQLANLLAVSARQRQLDLKRAAADPVLSAYLQHPSEEGRQAAETRLRSLITTGQQVIEVSDRAGEPVLTVASPPDAATSLAPRAKVSGAGVSLSETPQHLILSEVSEEITRGSGEAVPAGLGYLAMWRPVSANPTRDVLNRLVGGGAKIELGGKGGGPWTDLSTLVAPPPVDLSRGGVTEYRTAGGEPRLGALVQVVGTPWLVWIDFPESLFVAPARAFLREMSIIAVGFVALAVLAIRMLTGRITGRLASLTSAAEAISAGDYTQRVAADRPDEIGRLGAAFNAMVAEVRDAHGRLEARVRERSDALEALKESESRHRAIVELALDCIITIDDRGVVTEFNPASEATFGYRRSEVIGRELAELIIPARYREAHRQGMTRFLATGEGPVIGRLIELDGVRSNGEEFPLELAIRAIRLNDRLMFAAHLRDITERKRAERVRVRSVELEAENRRVREASRLKSEFLANMSHELRTPLNAIIGFSSILHEGRIALTADQPKEFLGHILTSGRHLLQLINDVLDLSKVEAGKLEFRPEPIDVERVITEVLAILKTTAAGKRISVRVSVDAAVREVQLDPARLKQVLYNYVSNALKFTPEGGLVEVRVVPEGADGVRLEVEDSGIGIAADDIERLFVEFQQLDSGSTKQHGGTGLGLALTKRLVEAQGGHVGVRSTIGVGSVFHATLPRRHDQAPQIIAPAPDPPSSMAGPSILVIEDDPRDRAYIVRVLSSAGYTVESATMGSEAVERSTRRAFDAITLDLLLPDQTGLDVLRQMRVRGKNPDAPVVVMTVVSEESALAGHVVSDVLPKPIDADALLASLRRAGVPPRPSNRVLIVDDDEPSVRLLTVTLEQLGYVVEGHTNPAAGLRSAAVAPPSVIVLDLLMPHLDGFEFIDELRRQPANQTTPVIVWSVKDLSAEEHRHLSESADRVLRKGHGGVDALLHELQLVFPRANGGT